MTDVKTKARKTERVAQPRRPKPLRVVRDMAARKAEVKAEIVKALA